MFACFQPLIELFSDIKQKEAASSKYWSPLTTRRFRATPSISKHIQFTDQITCLTLFNILVPNYSDSPKNGVLANGSIYRV
jgi:hypothetical protein